MKNRQYLRIEKNLKKYSETNIAQGEALPKATISRINKNYNTNQQKRRVDTILNNVRNKDSIKEEVYQIINEIPSLKKLCVNCKEELIISVIILYVLKSRNPRYHIERTALWKTYKLDWKKYSLIIGRLLQESRKSKILPYR